MFSVINRGELNHTTEHEFENLNSRLKGLWLAEHNEDGTHKFDVMGLDSLASADHTHDAADIISGTLDLDRIPTLTKAKQHTQTAYKDEANTFTLAQNVTILGGTTQIGNAGTDGGYIGVTSTLPLLDFSNTTAALNLKRWRIHNNASGAFNLLSLNDDFTGSVAALQLARNGDIFLTGKVYERSRISLALGEWTSYTPALTGSVSNPTNYTANGRYTIVGNTVHFVAHFSFGGASTFGSGFWLVSLPQSILLSGFYPAFNVFCYDASLNKRYVGLSEPFTGTTVYLLETISGAAITNVSPFTWASGDYLVVSGTYEMS